VRTLLEVRAERLSPSVRRAASGALDPPTRLAHRLKRRVDVLVGMTFRSTGHRARVRRRTLPARTIFRDRRCWA